MVCLLVKYWEIVVVQLDIMFLVLRVVKNRAITQMIAMGLKIAIQILNLSNQMNAIVMYHPLPRLEVELVIPAQRDPQEAERETLGLQDLQEGEQVQQVQQVQLVQLVQ